MVDHSTEISVSARYAELPVLLAEFGRQAGACGVDAGEIARQQLVIEELFTNTIAHGHGAESAESISVVLSHDSSGTHLRYIDNAPPFDLTHYVPDPAPAIGGLGIPLIRGMSLAIRYRWQAGRNITELDFTP